MTISLNKLQIIGHCGKDPEMKFDREGNAITTFSVACGSEYQKDGVKISETEWFGVVAFGKLAEICNQLLKKGSVVYVEGQLKTRTWDGQDGQKHSRTEVRASNFICLDVKDINNRGDTSKTSYDIPPF